MTGEELVENLGTIAHSGSKSFVEAIKAAKGNLSEGLIGQFGVGFYSVFMVSDRVDVYTAGGDGKGHHWSCDGSENFTIEDFDKKERGTKIVAKLKKECDEFSKVWRVKSILEKYSAYVDFPIELNGEKIGTHRAIWLKSKSELKKEDYDEFFKFHTHSAEEPIDCLHFKADAPVELNALIYIPASNPERLGFGKTECEVSLYCKKVLIDSRPEGLLPEWMRFAKGVIDSADIPLNISRESMQDSALVRKLGKVVTKRFLKRLAEIAKSEPEKYAKFFKNFGMFIKEGAATDFDNREELSKLLRFESSVQKEGEFASLEDYVSRMKDGQKEIFYAAGPRQGGDRERPVSGSVRLARAGSSVYVRAHRHVPRWQSRRIFRQTFRVHRLRRHFALRNAEGRRRIGRPIEGGGRRAQKLDKGNPRLRKSLGSPDLRAPRGQPGGRTQRRQPHAANAHDVKGDESGFKNARAYNKIRDKPEERSHKKSRFFEEVESRHGKTRARPALRQRAAGGGAS